MQCAKLNTKFEYHKNDCDEDGRIVKPSESCRTVQDNGRAFQMTYHFRVGGPKGTAE